MLDDLAVDVNYNSLNQNLQEDRLDGNVKVFQNVGGADIINNMINDDLQCKASDLVSAGENNSIQVNGEDQYAGL